MVLGLTLLLTILNVFTSSSYATEWFSIPDTRLTWDSSVDWAPSLTQAQDGRIWIVWHSFESSTNPDILYKVYNGSSTFPWSPTKKLTTDSADDMTPSITTTADGDIWVVWSSNRDENFEIYYKIYNGSFWTGDERLTTDSGVDEFPSVMQDEDGDIWVVWSSDRDGNFEIYYRIYNYTNKEWHPEEPLISNPATDRDPSITQAQDGTIWIVWVRGEDLFYKVFFRNMTDVVLDTPLTEEDSRIDWRPCIMQAQDGRIWVAWDSRADKDMDIYCKIYDGVWSEEQITVNSLDDFMPAILQVADGTVWVAWTSDRLDNFDIYYKTDSPPPHVHDMAIFSVTRDPNVTVGYQGLNVSIEVVSQNQGSEGEFVEVNCFANSTLIGSETRHLSAGQLMPLDFMWNTFEMIPGTYTIIANVTITGQIDTDPADNTFIDGQVHVKILGDVDGDGVVGASDLFALSKSYGSKPGNPNWNPNCDFNGDNKVDASDFLDLNENYGKTL